MLFGLLAAMWKIIMKWDYTTHMAKPGNLQAH